MPPLTKEQKAQQDRVLRDLQSSGPASPRPTDSVPAVQQAAHSAGQLWRDYISQPAEQLGERLHNATAPLLPWTEKWDPKLAGRLALEAGTSYAGAVAAPHLGVPAMLLRNAPRIAKGISVIPRILGSGLGASIGSLGAETFDPTEDPGKTAIQASITGAIAEPVAMGAERALAPFAHRLLPGAGLTAQRLATRGEMLTPALAVESKFVDVMQNIGEAALLGSRLPQRKLAAEQVIQRDLGDFAAQFGTPANQEALGHALQDAITGGEALFEAATTKLAARVDAALAPIGTSEIIDMRPAKVFAQKYLAEEPGKRMSRFSAEELKEMRQAGQRVTDLPVEERYLPTEGGGFTKAGKVKQMAEDILLLPDMVDFKRAQLIRSQALKARRVEGEIDPSKPAAFAGGIANRVDQAFTKAGQQLKYKPAVEAWRDFNRAYYSGVGGAGFGVKDFTDRAIGRIVDEANPSTVVKVLLNERTPESIRRVMRIAGSTKQGTVAAQKLKTAFVHELRLGTFPKQGDAMLGPQVGTEEALKSFTRPTGQELIQQASTIGDDAMDAFLGKAHAQDLKELMTALRRTQGKPRTEQLSLAVQFQQFGGMTAGAGAMYSLATGSGEGLLLSLGSAGAFLLLPAAVDRALANRAIARWLTRGVRHAGTKGAVQSFTRGMALAHKEGISGMFISPSQLESTLDWLERTGGPPQLVEEPAFQNVDALRQQMEMDPMIRREWDAIKAGQRRTFSRQAAKRIEQFDQQAQQFFPNESISISPDLPALPQR